MGKCDGLISYQVITYAVVNNNPRQHLNPAQIASKTRSGAVCYIIHAPSPPVTTPIDDIPFSPLYTISVSAYLCTLDGVAPMFILHDGCHILSRDLSPTTSQGVVGSVLRADDFPA